jgi:magnesium transporter
MMHFYALADEHLLTVAHDGGTELPPGTLWIAMVLPSVDEVAALEAALGVAIPTRDDMAEIETSSRQYVEGGTVYLTLSLATGILRPKEALAAELHPLAIMLTPHVLVTLRYTELTVIERLAAHCARGAPPGPAALLVQLLDAIVDRLADAIERTAGEIDAINRQAFRRVAPKGRQQRLSTLALQSLLQRIVSVQDALSKSRESAVSLARAVSFLGLSLPKDAGQGAALKSMVRDLASLTDHASYLSNTINFLLDTALGLINIEQNAVLKIFSIFAIVFMPPTLIAAIYGMNFVHMPELEWALGYPLAVALMLLSAVLPYAVARWRGWL